MKFNLPKFNQLYSVYLRVMLFLNDSFLLRKIFTIHPKS